MELTIAQLKENYAAKSTEDLVKLRATRQLTDMACAVIDAELRTRGVEESAVDTVRVETEAEERERETFRANLAPISARIAAYCIDFCGSIFVLFVIIFGLSVLGSNAAADAVSWKLVLAHWAYMLFKDGFEGQSLGKRLLGIQVISQTTGARAGSRPRSCATWRTFWACSTGCSFSAALGSASATAAPIPMWWSGNRLAGRSPSIEVVCYCGVLE